MVGQMTLLAGWALGIAKGCWQIEAGSATRQKKALAISSARAWRWLEVRACQEAKGWGWP